MYDALFRQAGVIRAQQFSDLLDIPAALATGRRLRGQRVAILTSTGGAGTLVSDSLGLSGFEAPPPDEETAAALRALQTGDHAALDRNPIDVTLAGLQPDLLRGAIRALLASRTYDALVIVVGSSALAMPELMANAIKDVLPESDKPVLAFVSPHAPQVAALLTRQGVPAFAAAESCAAALDGMRRHARWQAAEPDQVSAGAGVLGDLPSGSLDEAQAKQLFARFGIAGTPEQVVTSAHEAEQVARTMGTQVVLKVLSAQITHKSDVGGVAIDLQPQDVADRLRQMTHDVKTNTGTEPRQFLVQQMVDGGVEMILGLSRDALGMAILIGMGGVTAELFQDTALRLLPEAGGLSRQEVLSMLHELKTWPLLNGYRGRPVADVEALIDAVVAFSRMAAQLKDRLLEAEINPIFVLPQGRGVMAADGVVMLA
jgi:acyl-CoA synthetase (NDP forming)